MDDSLTVRHTNAGANQSVGANTSGGNENGGKAPDLKYTVESIDLGKYEEEKVRHFTPHFLFFSIFLFFVFFSSFSSPRGDVLCRLHL